MIPHNSRQTGPAGPPRPSRAHLQWVARQLWQAGLAFAVLAGSSPRAMATPGDLDVNFAGFGGGIVSDGACFRGMAVMPDGRIVVAGSSGTNLEVRRYLPNGTVDPTFSGDGIAVMSNPFGSAVQATCVAVSAAGRVVVGAWMGSSPNDYVLACLTPTGAVDSGFGTLGWVLTDFDNDADQVEAVAFQPDDKVLAAGSSRIGGDYDFSVARYNPYGVLDSSFSGDGKATVPFGSDDHCHDMTLQNDGKIVLVGSTENLQTSDYDFAVARLNTDGSLDNTFGSGGKVYVITPGSEEARGVAMESDGKIVVSGVDAADPDNGRVVRLTPGGSLDSSFDGDGKLLDANNSCEAVAVQQNGKIVVAGVHVSPDGDWKTAFHRLNADGTMDTSLLGGAEYIDLGASDDRCHHVAVLLDGRILGNCEHAGSASLVQIWPDGTLDSGGLQTVGLEDQFTQAGLQTEAVDASCLSMAVQGDGKVVLLGEVSNNAVTAKDIALTRLLPTGLVDASFGDDGRVQFGPFLFDQPRAVAVQLDGKIVVGGHMVSGSIVNFMVARLNSDGSVDGTFGFGGYNVLDFLGGDDYGSAMALAPDGKIVVAGTVFNGARFVFGVARFNTDGTPDNTFDLDAKQLYEFTVGATHEAVAVVVQPDDKIVVGGTVDGDFALVRFNENGSVDGTFGVSGRTITDMGGDDRLSALALAPNGWFYAAGTRNVGGNYDFALAQYKPTGTLATCRGTPCSNWPTGKAFVDFGGGDIAYAIDIRGDGRVVAAGRGNSQMAWAQFGTLSATPTVQATVDFPGPSESARAVRFTGLDRVLLGGSAAFNGDSNMAAARFWTTPGSIASGIDGPSATEPESAVRLAAAYPNPVSSRSMIRFAIPHEELVRLRVYDVSGRLVRTLVDGRLPVGEHTRAWNATDDKGRPVAAGVYFYRLETGTSVQRKSLVVIR